MPCNDSRTEVVYKERVYNGMNAARLCAVFKVLEAKGALDKVLAEVDWKEAGVSRTSTDKWCINHKKLDAIKRTREKKEQNLAKKAKALSLKPWASLSKAERELVRQYVD